MENLDYARLQMAFTLGFHIIFACIGMVMPFFMVVSHKKWLNTRKPIYLKLTKAWQRGVAIFLSPVQFREPHCPLSWECSGQNL